MNKVLVLDREAVNILLSCKSSDKYRDNLDGIHFPTNQVAETTDGHKMVRVPLESYYQEVDIINLPSVTDDLTGILLQGLETIKLAKTEVIMLGKVKDIESDSGSVDAYVCSFASGVYILKAVVPLRYRRDSCFPDTEKVIPKTEVLMCLGAGQLKQIITPLIQANSKVGLTIGVTENPDTDPLTLDVRLATGETTVQYVLMPYRMK